jgi:hypothetical protein
MAVAFDGLRRACEANRSSKQAEARKAEGERAAGMVVLLQALAREDAAAAAQPKVAEAVGG